MKASIRFLIGTNHILPDESFLANSGVLKTRRKDIYAFEIGSVNSGSKTLIKRI